MTAGFELLDITKLFAGVTALERVSLAIRPGEVHAVVGENGAGKSTLINILAGELQPDSGSVLIGGTAEHLQNPHVSQQHGISVVHQELALCPNLTVAENISLRRAAGRFPLRALDRRVIGAVARDALRQLGAESVPLDRPVSSIPLAQQQLVEIAKAMTLDARLLILDEPNSALTYEESRDLFRVVRDLRARGVSTLYVSHRLEEVLDLADRITVMRDGRVIATLEAQGTSVEQLIGLMVGREINALLQRHIERAAHFTVALEARGLSDARLLREIDFSVRSGEVLGVAGLPGSGKGELVECLFGVRSHTGELRVAGEPVRITSPSDAIRHGLALIPADRRSEGAMLVMDIRQNIVAACLERVSRFGMLDRSASTRLAREYTRKLDVRASGLQQRMATLSGGNQQKVILAKGLATSPSILLLHEPTRGIDVGAKAEIYRMLQDFASEGKAVVVVSSEMPELIGQCDRILVMHEGRITGEFAQHEADEERILACAMGKASHRPEGAVR
jgi:ABC-type sugar transport system ATPase subunit